MKRFLLGAMSSAVVFALAAFALSERRPAPAATNPIKYSDLTLDRVFRETLPVGAYPLQITLPPSGGIVITSIVANGGSVVQIQVNNGAPQTFSTTVLSNGQSMDVDPPIVVRPGDTLTFLSGQGTIIGGYATYAGET